MRRDRWCTLIIICTCIHKISALADFQIDPSSQPANSGSSKKRLEAPMQHAPSTTFQLHSNLSLQGRSRASDGTSFVVPEQGWVFDAGAIVRPGRFTVKHLFLSHTHADHISALPHILTNANTSPEKPIKIYLPHRAVSLLNNFLQSHIQLTQSLEENHDDDGSTTNDQPYYFELVACKVGNRIELPQGYIVDILDCDHRIDCIGFNILQRKRSLRDEYRSLSKKDQGALCRTHKQTHGNLDALMVESLEPVFCFLGDTTTRIFDIHPEILKQRYIVMECTYVDGTSDNAIKYRHAHWADLRPIVEQNGSTLFLLIHFSLRYSDSFLRDCFSSFSNVHLLLPVGLEQVPEPDNCPCFFCRSKYNV